MSNFGQFCRSVSANEFHIDIQPYYFLRLFALNTSKLLIPEANVSVKRNVTKQIPPAKPIHRNFSLFPQKLSSQSKTKTRFNYLYLKFVYMPKKHGHPSEIFRKVRQVYCTDTPQGELRH